MRERRSREQMIAQGKRFLAMLAAGDTAADIATKHAIPRAAVWSAVNAARVAVALTRANAVAVAAPRDPDVRAPWSYCDGELLDLVRKTRAEMEAAVARGWTPEQGFGG